MLCLKNKEVREKEVIEQETYISLVDDYVYCIITCGMKVHPLLHSIYCKIPVLLVWVSNERFPTAGCYLLPLAELISREYFKSKQLIHGIFIASDFHSRGTCRDSSV